MSLMDPPSLDDTMPDNERLDTCTAEIFKYQQSHGSLMQF